MVDKMNIEMFYDYFDGVANLLYHSYQKSYIEGMNEAFNYLLDDNFEGEYEIEDISLMKDMKEKIIGINFEPEEVRKSVQLGLLKGYKHSFSSNALMTPDTIGIFIGYLVKKLYPKMDIMSVLDPLIGTGNLVYSTLNHIELNAKVFGVDNDLLKCNIARNLGDLMDYENEMFYQETLSYYDSGFDLILTDMPTENAEDDYLPFKVINHHLDNLKDGGYMISVIENDFFEKKGSDIFKEEIDKKGYITGLIRLSESLFKTSPKSILIIRKKGDNVSPHKDFLLVDLPSFNDIEHFNKTIIQIDNWFKIREESIK